MSQLEDPERLERIKRAAHLHVVVGLTWDETAQATGFNSPGGCQRAVDRYVKEMARATEKELEPLIHQADMRYDYLRRRAHAILVADHPLVQGGEIIRDAEGRPLRDAGPQLAALSALLRIEDAWADLHGIKASKKLEIALNVRADVESNLVAEAVLAAAEALELEPQQRMLALEAAARRLDAVDGEVISDEADG